jgi:hypothetical protein
MQEFRGEDWEFSYTGNRFGFLGNGISHAEFDPTSDIAYYLKDEDDGVPMTRRETMKVAFRSGSQPKRMLHFTHRPDVINLPERKKRGDEIARRNSLLGLSGLQRFRSFLFWPAMRVGYIMKRVWIWMHWSGEQ